MKTHVLRVVVGLVVMGVLFFFPDLAVLAVLVVGWWARGAWG